MNDVEILKNERNLQGEKITDFVNEGSTQWKLLINAMNNYAKKEVLKAIDCCTETKGKHYAIGFAGGLAFAVIIYYACMQ